MNEFDSSRHNANKAATRLCSFHLAAHGGPGGGAERLAGSLCPVCQPRLVPPPSAEGFLEGADHMNHQRKSDVSHQRRSLQKIRYPRFRYSIVGLLPTAQENKPMILLSGNWLREFGFGFNQRLKVVPSPGKIVIESLLSESAFNLCTMRHPYRQVMQLPRVS